MDIIKRLINEFRFLFRSLIRRSNRKFFFAKKIQIDSDVTLKAGLGTRVFGVIAAFDSAKVILGKDVIINSSSMLSTSGGMIDLLDGCQIGKHVLLQAGRNDEIIIGKRTTFYGNALLSGNIKVGNDVLFSPNVTILSSTHCINGRRSIRQLDKEYIKHHGGLPDQPIQIGDECWIGVNSVILPGTLLGTGCVVAAGAIVKGVFPDYAIIGGVPAKIVKYR